MNANEVHKQGPFWEICRQGTLERLLTLVENELILDWRTRYQTKRTRISARKRHRDESSQDEIETPWLKKPRGSLSSADEDKGDGHGEKEDFQITEESNVVRESLENDDSSGDKEFACPPNSSDKEATRDPLGIEVKSTSKEGGESDVKVICVEVKKPRSLLVKLCEGSDAEETSFLEKRLRWFCNSKDKLQRNGLHLAASAGNCEIIQCLSRSLSDNEPIISIKSTAQDGMQAIHFAALSGHVEAVKECIKAGAKVNCAYGRAQKTPLLLAERKGHTLLIEYLKGKGGRLKGEIQAMEEDESFQAVLDKLNLTK